MAQEERTSEWSMNFRLLFRSLKYRNFRLFFMGQGISLIGTWMQMTAVAWLVWRLSHSALLLGLVGFAARIPTFVMAPLAGVLVVCSRPAASLRSWEGASLCSLRLMGFLNSPTTSRFRTEAVLF